ncbi:MAG: SulP family inorganic anion transporter [Acidimicrobiales bacterium]
MRLTIPTLPERSILTADLVAGLTVAAMLVPQAMAYALLAGLPPEVGLYASTVPLVLYAVIGTSRQLAVGPVAIVSLLTASALGTVAQEGTAGYVSAAATLALLVGAVHLVLGAGRLGFLVRLLSHPVLIGFTTAAALIIGASQVKHVLGVSVPRTHHFHDRVWELVQVAPSTHLLTFTVGAGAIALMVALKRWVRAAPAALSAVAVTTVASVVFDLQGRGVAVVGEIPQGLPPLTLPSDLGLVGTLLPAALVITMVGFMESIAVGKVYARRNRYELDSNRELFGLGLANIGAGLAGGYPVTGGFSRTAVNADAGARTKLAGIIAAAIVLVVIVAFTPLFRQLPAATLGAIVLVAVAKLVDIREMRHVRAVKTSDLITMSVAFVATLALGIELGIAVAVAASLVVVAARMMAPHTAVLGQLPGTGIYRNLERFPDAQRIPGIEVIRFDVSLSHLNVEFMKRRVARLVEEAPPGLDAVVIDASGVNDIDTSAVEALDELITELGSKGVVVHLAAVKGPVRDVLMRAGLYQRLGDRVHPDVDHAVVALTGPADEAEPTEHADQA